MGLFDGLQFNPQSFGAGQQGLLSNLLSQIQYQNPQGPGFGTQDNPLQYGQTSNVAVGNYQMPVFGQGDPATIPTNAQPTSGPVPQQQADPSVGDRLNGFFNGYANNKDRGVIGGLVGAISGAVTGNAPENQTVKSLVARGLDTNTAQIVARDPTLLRAVLPQLMGTGGQTNDIKEYEYAKRQGFQGSLDQWMAQKRAGAGEYSLTPVYGTNDKGETVLIQPGKSGTAIQTVLPPNVKISAGVEKIDLGTQWGVLDKKSGQIIGYQPKDLRGAERERGIGDAQGKAVASAPGDLQAGQNALDILQKIRANPYLERGTGFSSVANVIPGTGGYDFSNLVEQAKSGAFLQAIQQMRGLGSLSNAEGGAATAAITRMNTATSKEAFLDALADYEKVVKQGMARANARLSDPSATNPQPAATAPAQGAAPSVDDLLKKYGGR